MTVTSSPNDTKLSERKTAGALWLVLFGCMTSSGWADEQRFAVQLANGSRQEGQTLQDWHDLKKQPRVGNHPLFHPENPVRSLIDRDSSPARAPASYVEFVGGDRLPGRVVEALQGDESPFLHLPPHLVVEPDSQLSFPGSTFQPLIRVSQQWISRIAWHQTHQRPFRPGRVYLRDGREIRYRSLRWESTTITLLLQEGVQTVPLGDLSEIHLHRQDDFQAYREQFAELLTAAETKSKRLWQLETTEGLVATTSQERFEPKTRGNHRQSENWYHQIQPAWSFDPFWVRFGDVRAIRFFDAHQLPMSGVLPTIVEQKASFGNGWQWQLNRNAQGLPLKSAEQEYAWGYGVHGWNRLEFTLPAMAQSFRVRGGLDSVAGSGGCVKALIELDGKTIFQSEVLIGSEKQFDTNWLNFQPSESQRKLVLLVDSLAAGDRPPGSDPFDIRDTFNWLEPEVKLDPAWLQETNKRPVDALAGWKVTSPVEMPLERVHHWDKMEPSDTRYRVGLKTKAEFVTFTKRMRVGKDDRWLGVAVERLTNQTPGSTVQICLNDRETWEFEVPLSYYRRRAVPLIVPVDRYRGKTVNVRLTWIPDKDEAAADWRAVSTFANRPDRLPLFEDELTFPGKLAQGAGTVQVMHEDAYTGVASLQVTNLYRGNAQIGNWNFPIREYPDLGEYRWICFAWKQPAGRVMALEVAHDGRLGGVDDGVPGRPKRDREPRPPRRRRDGRMRRTPVPLNSRGEQFGYRYDVGSINGPYEKTALRLDRRTPGEWVYIVRDLYSEFGNFDLTGLGFFVPEDGVANFDHIYLARRPEEFNQLPFRLRAGHDYFHHTRTLNDPNIVEHTTTPEEYGDVLGPVASGFSIRNVKTDGIWLLKEHQGRGPVLRTHPLDANRAAVLRKPISIPKDGKTTLQFGVSCPKNTTSRIFVKIKDKTLYDEVLKSEELKNGWKDVSVDLNAFAGQTVLLELHHDDHQWGDETAYWSSIRVRNTGTEN